jgi:hypothetical protein
MMPMAINFFAVAPACILSHLIIDDDVCNTSIRFRLYLPIPSTLQAKWRAQVRCSIVYPWPLLWSGRVHHFPPSLFWNSLSWQEVWRVIADISILIGGISFITIRIMFMGSSLCDLGCGRGLILLPVIPSSIGPKSQNRQQGTRKGVCSIRKQPARPESWMLKTMPETKATITVSLFVACGY